MALQSGTLRKRYALEILESIGNYSPAQTAIDQVERFLHRVEKNSSTAPRFKRYQIKTAYQGKILLLQEQNFLSCAHAILFKNMGFNIDHVDAYEKLNAINLHDYQAIIIAEYFSGLKPLTIIKQLKTLLNKDEALPKILVLINKNHLTEDKIISFSNTIVGAIPMPVIFNQLNNLLREFKILPVADSSPS